jgi:hypothetical protein
MKREVAMRFLDWLQQIDQPFAFLVRWVRNISAIVTAVGFISSFFAWGRTGPFQFLTDNLLYFWWTLVIASVVTLWIRVFRLDRRFTSRFKDSFKSDLRIKWDYDGPWRIVDHGTWWKSGTLLVTGSDAGGITKTGAAWENYVFSFRARINEKCLGVVVRAQDLNNYYMFQIGAGEIRPHRRITAPVIVEDEDQPSESSSQKIRPVYFLTRWQTPENTPDFISVAITPALNGWFHVRVEVSGESVSLHIDDELRFQKDAFLKIPTGKVGFRNYDDEMALVQNVRVTLQL